MLFRLRLLALVGILIAVAAVSVRSEPAQPDKKVAFFEKKVRPILVSHCYTCHSADTKPAGDLRVDDRNGLLAGGKSGPAIVPGQPDKSLLLKRVSQKEAKRRMPLEGEHLSGEQVAILTKWVRDGAAWPAVKIPFALGEPKPRYEKLKKTHWAWQPLTDPKVPAVRDSAWPRDSIDRFLLARLEAKGLRPVEDVDRVTLLRRVTFDLTGLPPTPEAIDAFLRDRSPAALARVVDRLLGSPRFGEQWGRHWLDIARYGESTGPSRNIPYPHAWRYRDYVIDSVNADVPFDRFVEEQVAGDLLPADTPGERDRLATASGFLALGVKDVNQRFKVRFVMDNVDEQIDVVTRSVLGLTATCARCHDHKFDPIPSADYYALAGIFTSTDNCAGVRNKMGGGGLDYYDPAMLVRMTIEPPPPPAEEVNRLKQQFAKAKAEWDAIRGTPEGLARGSDGFPRQRPYRLKFERARGELANLTDPASRGYAVHGVRDSSTVGDTEIRIRGEAEKLGPVVPRGFLSAFEVPGAAPVNRKQSGRLELARWLTSPNNPLTARVIVNRVWQRLFGQGIVTTVDNFGVTGDTPSHPELLDHLASRFIREGWSVKKLVRALVLTRAYQLGTDAPAGHKAVDPGNRLVWRHSSRRLGAEEIRDAILAAAGTLTVQRPEASPARKLQMIEMQDNGPQARALHTQADRSQYRSVYLPLVRGLTPHDLEAFDPVEQTLVTGQRDTTTVPGQTLYLLNSSFVRRQSLALAEKLLGQPDADSVRIQTAYRLILGRLPQDRETERARRFLAGYEAGYREQPAAAPTEKPKTPGAVEQEEIRPADGRSAAWLALVQALFSSAEFRYSR
jgi:cytochrome c553